MKADEELAKKVQVMVGTQTSLATVLAVMDALRHTAEDMWWEHTDDYKRGFGAGWAGARLAVEEVMTGRHALVPEEIREALNPDGAH